MKSKTSNISILAILSIFLSCTTPGHELSEKATALWSFETVSNQTVPDEIGDFHGQVQGNPLISEGIKGNCLLFDGVHDYIHVSGTQELSLSDGRFSISVWLNLHVLNAGPQVIIASRSIPSDLPMWELQLDKDNRFRFCKPYEQAVDITSTTIPRPGLWYNVIVTGDERKIKMYVNGKPEAELKQTGLSEGTAAQITIGGRWDEGNTGEMFYGAIDEIMISKQPFSARAIRKSFRDTYPAESTYTPILPEGWDPVLEADQVLERLISVTAPQVKGAHDADFIIAEGKAYIVSQVNDARPGHSNYRTDEYTAMSVVNLRTLEVELASLPIAVSEQVFENAVLPEGQTWVPRIIRKDNNFLRIYFVSQLGRVPEVENGEQFAQYWYRDYDISRQAFENKINRLKLRTSLGTFDMQPRHFHDDAVKHGFQGPLVNYGIYLFDSFKIYDGITYIAFNNFPGRQNALGRMSDNLDTLEIISHLNEPQHLQLSEASVERLNDGTWLAIFRTQTDNRNYAFSESRDGQNWTPAGYRGFVRNGDRSKPTFNRFNGIYYLGWQDAMRIDNVRRSVFNIDVSRDGLIWERKYRFETTDAFQYPTFKEADGRIWLTISGNKQSTIKFGWLEDLQE